MALWINDGLHEAAQGIRSFLLVGQSNMAGRGDLTPENAITAPDCFMLRMGRWQPMSEPINVDRAVAEGAVPRSGANLAASFAAQLQKETGAKIGLIPFFKTKDFFGHFPKIVLIEPKDRLFSQILII